MSEVETALSGKVPFEVIRRIVAKGLTLRDLSLMDERDLSEKIGIDRSLARKIILLSSESFVRPLTADELLRIRRKRLSTGIYSLDELLGGGIEEGALVGVYGPPASGKTQLLLHLLARSLLKDTLSSDTSIYIDTEGSFDPERMLTYLKSVGLDERHMARIKVLDAPSPHLMMSAAESALEHVKSGCRFLSLDSLSAPLVRYKGLKRLHERSEVISKVLDRLRKAADLGAVVVFTVHVTEWGRDIRPKGGHIVGHIPQIILFLERPRDDRVFVRLVGASHLPMGEAVFRITRSGLSGL